MILESDNLNEILRQNSHLYSHNEIKELLSQIGNQHYLEVKEIARLELLKQEVLSIQLNDIERKLHLGLNLTNKEIGIIQS